MNVTTLYNKIKILLMVVYSLELICCSNLADNSMLSLQPALRVLQAVRCGAVRVYPEDRSWIHSNTGQGARGRTTWPGRRHEYTGREEPNTRHALAWVYTGRFTKLSTIISIPNPYSTSTDDFCTPAHSCNTFCFRPHVCMRCDSKSEKPGGAHFSLASLSIRLAEIWHRPTSAYNGPDFLCYANLCGMSNCSLFGKRCHFKKSLSTKRVCASALL